MSKFVFTVNATEQSLIEEMIMNDEGGWVFTDNANDPGGMTYAGMTYQLFSDGMRKEGESISPDTFKHAALTDPIALRTRVIQVYCNEYMDTFAGKLKVEEWGQEQVFSCAVNMGIDDVWVIVQQCLNVLLPAASKLTTDGVYGPKTRHALFVIGSRDNLPQLFNRMWQMRYVELVQKNCEAWEKYTQYLLDRLNGKLTMKQIVDFAVESPKFKRWKDLKGWLNRVDRYRTA